MQASDMPTIYSTNYNDSVLDYGRAVQDSSTFPNYNARRVTGFTWDNDKDRDVLASMSAMLERKETKKEPEIVSDRRIVNIYIVDADERVKLEDAILYKDEGVVTEEADADLLYGIDIKGIVEKHNIKRLATLDEDASLNRDKDVFLKAIKPSELSMRIVTLVQF